MRSETSEKVSISAAVIFDSLVSRITPALSPILFLTFVSRVVDGRARKSNDAASQDAVASESLEFLIAEVEKLAQNGVRARP